MSTTQTTPKIRRRGFQKAPATIREQANRIASEYFCGDCSVYADLRPTSYCGPGSAGDNGAWSLDLNSYCKGHAFRVIYPK